jgi:energy-coupling factor transporter ATP-binding protein EcfA2
MAGDQGLIELRDVSCSYPLPDGERRPALREISLHVREAEVLVVLGAGGAGKTTLACVLAGVTVPEAGTVRLEQALSGPGGSSLPVGLVTQNPEDTFTSPVVREEMGLILQNLEWEDGEIDRAVDAMLAEVGLGDHAEASPTLLSGGQKQLLALASTLIADPALLVLDEPLSLLDRRGREEVSALLSRRAEQAGRGAVYLSSEVGDALRGDRTIVLAGGGVAWEGPSAELPLSEETLAEWGLLTPDLSRLAGLLFPPPSPEGRALWRADELARRL